MSPKENESIKNRHEYDDIIDLPHHVSQKHPQMSALNRAAQFSPFAALTGHGAAIEETARLAEEIVESGGELKTQLEKRLRQMQRNSAQKPPP